MTDIQYITITDLAALTGRHPAYLSRLVTQQVLPRGKRVWKHRYLPKAESLAVLSKIGRRKATGGSK